MRNQKRFLAALLALTAVTTFSLSGGIINSGTVNATGGQYAAGIGSGYQAACGNITIAADAAVTATKGGNNSIGAGDSGSCGKITIDGEEKGNITVSPYIHTAN